jgi:hypothetical protein
VHGNRALREGRHGEKGKQIFGQLWHCRRPCKGRKHFFSEEKKQKTFIPPQLPTIVDLARIYPRAPEIKVFWFFSSEKNILACPGLPGS